jgi:hypothetical protein
MKFIVSLLLIALVSFVAGLYMDWWSVALAAFVVTLCIHQRPGRAFLAGFLALLFLWGGLAWWIDVKNDSVLSHRLALLLPLGGSSFLMILASGLVAALVAGFASLSASYLGKKR